MPAQGLAFSEVERDRLYLRGLLPPAILSQARNFYMMSARTSTRHAVLSSACTSIFLLGEGVTVCICARRARTRWHSALAEAAGGRCASRPSTGSRRGAPRRAAGGAGGARADQHPRQGQRHGPAQLPDVAAGARPRRPRPHGCSPGATCRCMPRPRKHAQALHLPALTESCRLHAWRAGHYHFPQPVLACDGQA